MNDHSKKSLGRFFWMFFGCYTVFKFFFVHWNAADSMDSLSYINWDLIGHSRWRPVYPALIELFDFMHSDRLIVGRMVSIGFSCLILIPLFQVSRTIFSNRVAWLTLILYVVAPHPFRWSVRALAEAPFAFFLLLSLKEVQQFFHEKSLKSFIFLGFWGAITSLTRPEGLILCSFFFFAIGVLIIGKKWRHFLNFYFPVILFLWGISIFWESVIETPIQYTNNIFNSLLENYHDGFKKAGHFLYYYLIYFIYTLGGCIPFFAFFSGRKIWRSKDKISIEVVNQRKLWVKINFVWLIGLFFVLSFHIGWSTRFLNSLAILILPFVAYFLVEISTKWIRNFLVVLSVSIYLSLSILLLSSQKELFKDIKEIGLYVQKNLKDEVVYFNEVDLLPYYCNKEPRKIDYEKISAGDYLVLSNFYDLELQIKKITSLFNVKLLAERTGRIRAVYGDDIFFYSYYREDGSLAEGANANIPIDKLHVLFRESISRSILLRVLEKKSS